MKRFASKTHTENTAVQQIHKRAQARKTSVIVTALCLLALMGGGLLALWQHIPKQAGETPPLSQSVAPAPQPTITTLSVAACGDNLIHDGLYLQARRRGDGTSYNFDALYENVTPFFKNYDINWINQETLVTDDFAPSGYPAFCSPTGVIDSLYAAGFRVFALSNNHSYDKGAAGIASTQAHWASRPADVVSYGLYPFAQSVPNATLQTVKDVTIAYLAYTEHTNGIPTPADALEGVIYTSQTHVIEQQIRAAGAVADAVVVSVHWGTEDSHTINDAQRTLAQSMADWGANIIIGTHPHVVQGVEFLTAAQSGNKVPVYYCLGNFVSLQQRTNNLLGLIGTFNLTKTTQPDGSSNVIIDAVKATPVIMHYDSGYSNGRLYLLRDYTPELAATHGARANNNNFSLEFLNEILTQNISSEVLVLD